MKCRYSFPISGSLRLADKVPIVAPDREVEFTVGREGVVTAVSVTVNAGGAESWPTIRPGRQPGVRADFNLNEPRYDEITADLRVLEGLLAFYGLERIDFESRSVKWLPENGEESRQLAILSFSSEFEPLGARMMEPAPIDFLARAVLVASRARDLEIPLSFFRKGMTDVGGRRFIDAFYEFYFMMETLFAQGRSRSKAVKSTFRGSPLLRAAIERTLQVMESEPRTKSLEQAFMQKYRGRSVDQAIDHFVELRGHLHHHFSRNPRAWHPERHADYEIDALVAFRVAGELALALAAPYLQSGNIAVSVQEGPPPFVRVT